MIAQGTPEWLKQRLGKVTGSRVADVMARTKTGYGASRQNYMAELIVERLTGQQAERFTNAAMQWGTDTEPFARAHYETAKEVLVLETGFCQHEKIEHFGASPDGLVNSDGLVEIKCPNTATHISTLTGSSIDSKYIIQMQSQMACTGRQWCDFVSYDPRLPEGLDYFCKRVLRDDKFIAEMEAEILAFLIELNGTLEKLNKLRSIE